MRTWQYRSDIAATTREQRVYRHPDDIATLTLADSDGARTRAVTERRAFDIHASGNFLRPRFTLDDGQQQLWRLSARSPFRSSYRLEGASFDAWTISTPFFNTRVAGRAGADASLEGCIAGTRDNWLFSFSGTQPTDELVIAVAFLHRFSFFHK